MNDHQYTNLRNYLEEIASKTTQLLAEQKRTNELLAGQGGWTKLPVDKDGFVIGKAQADETGQQVFTPKVTKIPAEAVGPVTVETVQTIDKPDAHLDAVTQKVDTKKAPAKKGKGKPGNVTPNVNWNS